MSPIISNSDKIAACYVRVSTGYQIERDSLPFQKKELLAYCKHVLHLDNVEVFEDAGKSGKNTDRPAYQRMIKKVRSGLISHIIVYKIDRISRNLIDFSSMFEEFKKYDVNFISLNEQFDTSSAMGEAMLKIILVFAELERKTTSERVTGVMIGRAISGKWNGARMPFGWRWNAEMEFPEHDPTEAPEARLLYEMYYKLKSTPKLRDYCYDNNIGTKRGGKWNTATLAGYLRNPMNKGDYRYNYRSSARGKKKPEDEIVYVEGVFPPLVDPDLWNRVNSMMSDHDSVKRKSSEHLGSRIHVFGGLLRCADCGKNFQASSLDRPRLNGFRPSLYACTSRKTYRSCAAPYASEIVVGPFVFNYISNLVQCVKARKTISGPEDLEKILLSGPDFANVRCINTEDLNVIFQSVSLSSSGAGSSLSYIPNPVKITNSPDIKKLQDESAKTERALDRLKKVFLYDDSGIPENEYLSTRSELTEKLTKIRNQIADLDQDNFDKMSELSFVNSASAFLISYRIQSGEHIEYPDLASTVDPQILKDFISGLISDVVIKDAHPIEIVFRNGLRNRFIYNDL